MQDLVSTRDPSSSTAKIPWLFLHQRNLGDKTWESGREGAAFMEECSPQAKQV